MLPVIEISLPAQLGSTSSNVPAFLAKLWKMVDNPDAGGSRVLVLILVLILILIC